ncbi:hypothetical protein [Streptomyces sp. cf124]|uniref:hypothetical protein n=1 Tax=Streptomyces sp. cf124 TaxID=1761903 RepID=UPI0011601185|nr:hypothetical protein [Streptomyces sp. cf124]
MTDPNTPPPTPHTSDILGDSAKRINEVQTLITAVAAVVAFINGVGGLVEFLWQVGTFVIPSYVALIFAFLFVMGVEKVLSDSFSRTLTGESAAILFVMALLGGVFFLRFKVFVPTEFDDTAAGARIFACLMGGAILLAPIIIWLLRKGSTPNPSNDGGGDNARDSP